MRLRFSMWRFVVIAVITGVIVAGRSNPALTQECSDCGLHWPPPELVLDDGHGYVPIIGTTRQNQNELHQNTDVICEGDYCYSGMDMVDPESKRPRPAYRQCAPACLGRADRSPIASSRRAAMPASPHAGTTTGSVAPRD